MSFFCLFDDFLIFQFLANFSFRGKSGGTGVRDGLGRYQPPHPYNVEKESYQNLFTRIAESDLRRRKVKRFTRKLGKEMKERLEEERVDKLKKLLES